MNDEFEGLLLVHTDEGTKVAGKIKEMKLLLKDYPGTITAQGGHLEMDLRSES